MIQTLGLLGLALNAHAIAPSDSHFIGIEPTRVHQVHGQEQFRLQQTDAWQAFAADEGMDWDVRFDEITETPQRMWGPGIPLGAQGAAVEVGQAVLDFALRNRALFGVEPGDLSVKSAALDGDTWYVDLQLHAAGLPVYRGGLTARVVAGELVMFGGATYPRIPVQDAVTLSAAHAVDLAIAGGPAPSASHTETSADLVMLPVDTDDGLQLVATYEVRSRTFTPPGKWVTYVDAATGELLNVHNEVRFLEGTVWAEHNIRTIGGGTTTSPLPNVRVYTDVDILYANEFGEYDIPDADAYGTNLYGQQIRVNNGAGNNGFVEFTGDTPDITWTSNDATPAELNTYVFLDEIRAWGREYSPGMAWANGTNVSNVNLDDVCNAYYDGTVNFFRAGGGCNNTGQIADVNYHEWGHGFHEYSLISGSFDGSVSEGAADVVSFLQTKDNVLAPTFMSNGGGIRDVAPNQAYPGDFVNSFNAVHSNGLIFGGSMWDLLWLLADDFGEDVATDTTSRLLAGSLKGGPEVPTSFDEVRFADDDDGDLSNGTPNECSIIQAFGLHGLGPLGSATALAGFDPVPTYPAAEDSELGITLLSPAPNCFDIAPEAGALTYRVDGGDWQTIELTTDLQDARGLIPAQELGSLVEYYIELEDFDGRTYHAPTGGEMHPYTFYVGDVLEVGCNDFEDDDGGFTHELVSGEDREGADDWQWGRPRGMAGDPSKAHSGNKVWGNDLGGGEYNGEYQNEKRNRLTTPEYTTRHYQGVFLHYWRWLQVEDGFYDQASIWADGELVWTNWGTRQQNGEEHTLDDQWMPHSVPLNGAGDDGTVSFSWEINSDQGLAFGGWTLDDVCVFAPATADNRLGVSDFRATDSLDDGIELTWTNPIHAPLDRVVVVRNANSVPTGPTDGQVVFDDREPQLEAPQTVRDSNVFGSQTYHYAVFASDGDAWLSWTVDGWNADDGVSNGSFFTDLSTDGTVNLERAAGCGCNATSGGAVGWLGLLLPGLLVARRRR